MRVQYSDMVVPLAIVAHSFLMRLQVQAAASAASQAASSGPHAVSSRRSCHMVMIQVVWHKAESILYSAEPSKLQLQQGRTVRINLSLLSCCHAMQSPALHS